MERYDGTSVLDKIAIGKIFFYKRGMDTPYREQIKNVTAETARFEAARETAICELDDLRREAKRQVGEENAALFEAQKMLVRDYMYHDYVCDAIQNQHVNAEYAVVEAQAYFVRMLAEVGDEYMEERAADVQDISERLLRLLGGGTETAGPSEPSILAANELTPSEMMHLDRSVILAIVVRRGGVNSHAAILARAMDIPALFGVNVREDWADHTAVVDGDAGEIILDPDEACLMQMREKQRETMEREASLLALRQEESVTKSGWKIRLYANIGDLSDMEAVKAGNAEGIGLFRSEFLYMQAQGWPTEEEQFAVYRAVAEEMKGRQVIVRTLDAGADKQIPYFNLSAQDEPDQDVSTGEDSSVGNRGIRVCLGQPEMFCTQLKAILRAGVYGTVSVMFPTIVSMEEIRACKEMLERAKTQLRDAACAFGDVEVGVMIETPEAVEISRELAREVDFFSIGTNDLTQYLLGADRMQADRNECGDPCHPAVLQAIRTTIENAHAAGIWVGICGEMAADPAMTETLVGMGIDELSVAPGALLRVREKIRSLD